MWRGYEIESEVRIEGIIEIVLLAFCQNSFLALYLTWYG